MFGRKKKKEKGKKKEERRKKKKRKKKKKKKKKNRTMNSKRLQPLEKIFLMVKAGFWYAVATKNWTFFGSNPILMTKWMV